MKRTVHILLLAGGSLTLLGGCSTEGNKPEALSEPFPVSILTTEFTGNPIQRESRLWRMLEEYTNTKLDIAWVPNASYNDKINITLASGTLPMIIKVEDTGSPGVASAIQKGKFWDIGPYLNLFPNLKQADPTILRNISINGKAYGIYRARPVGRLGISYRKDWAEKLKLKEPATIEDFYKMLKAFTFEDPDQNGKNDTYGLVISKYDMPWNMMQVWFGAPNKWGIAEDGQLIPDHMTAEYRESLRFFRKLYEEGLVNPDFPILDPTRWNDEIVNGRAGVMLDVADSAGRLETGLAEKGISGEIDILGAVSGPKGLRSLGTPGYNGVYLISRNGVKTEEELLRVLDFLDKLNDDEMQKLLSYGVEGIHYELQDGRMVKKSASQIPADYNENDLGQLLPMIPDRKTYMFKPATPLREKVNRVIEANNSIIVANPAEGLESSTYLQKGTMLDDAIEDARTRYITGGIDDAGFDRAVEDWRLSGGEDIIREINDAYIRFMQGE
jgi:putative aldouronate transport system substrate-binding protein